MRIAAALWLTADSNSLHLSDENRDRRTSNGKPAPSTILVVEDEVLVRLAVSDFLRGCGYRVLEAPSAEDAQAIFGAGEPIEIVITDVNLGKMTGFELATWIRDNHRDVRVVLTSGVAKWAREASDLCNELFLQKPYRFEELLIHIKRLLGSQGTQSG